MRITAGIFIFLCGMHGMLGQGNFQPGPPSEFSPITPYDSVMLVNLPELPLLPVLKSSDLPYFLDNSELPYYRPIYEQVASECGQVSGIGYNFTYEIDRLRDLPAIDSANQYPPHFPYNFMHDGSGYYGVSYFHSFEVLKALGCPTVQTYGGMAAGGNTRWMTGYDNYLVSMSNRIQEVYQIKVGTEEGLITLKHWLHNHLDGSAIGGVASFYSNAPWNMHFLPAGTPEAGKKVITHWSGLPTHAMTITGYNDSIRWDYNMDGQYTNHLDINGDDTVDLRDWEIGGMLFADGWNGGINFGDSGKCYMMYKTLAEKVWAGGIWNNAVHVLDVKDLDKPRLTAKVRLTHNSRNMLRVRCGVSSNDNGTIPEQVIGFPVFNFQGGSQYMQGGVELEENKTIEFGLDISPLLGLLTDNDFKQFFLIVEEHDPDSEGTGVIEYFSVIDYTGSVPAEEYCTECPIPIISNSITYASLVFSSDLDIMKVKTEELPAAVVNEPYSIQLEVEGGTAPVKWSLMHAVHDTEIQDEIEPGGTFVEANNLDYGNYKLALPFSFPFYGEMIDTIYISPKGFITFDDNTFPWPYMHDPPLMLSQIKCIAPLMCRYLDIIAAFGHGIWILETDEQVSIRWIADVDWPDYSPLLEFGMKLFEDGRIIFNYGNDFDGRRLEWTCGISKGDQLNYYIPGMAENIQIHSGDAITLECVPLPEGMQISEQGEFSGTPHEYYKEVDMVFCAEDNDHIRAFRTLKFSATGLGIADKQFTDIDIKVYPNPFNHQLSIQFPGDLDSPLKCDVYSSGGLLVKTLVQDTKVEAGDIIRWDGSDASGHTCAPGIYYLHLRSGGHSMAKKLIYTGH